jgi:hypothetical protein
MPRHQCNQPISSWVEERIGPYQERTHLLLSKAEKGRVYILVRPTIENNKPLSEGARRFLHIVCVTLPLRTVLVHKQADHLILGNELPQQPKPFCSVTQLHHCSHRAGLYLQCM